MSILDRLFGGDSAADERCCDVRIEEVDDGEADERSPDERVGRAED